MVVKFLNSSKFCLHQKSSLLAFIAIICHLQQFFQSLVVNLCRNYLFYGCIKLQMVFVGVVYSQQCWNFVKDVVHVFVMNFSFKN